MWPIYLFFSFHSNLISRTWPKLLSLSLPSSRTWRKMTLFRTIVTNYTPMTEDNATDDDAIHNLCHQLSHNFLFFVSSFNPIATTLDSQALLLHLQLYQSLPVENPNFSVCGLCALAFVRWVVSCRTDLMNDWLWNCMCLVVRHGPHRLESVMTVWWLVAESLFMVSFWVSIFVTSYSIVLLRYVAIVYKYNYLG